MRSIIPGRKKKKKKSFVNVHIQTIRAGLKNADFSILIDSHFDEPISILKSQKSMLFSIDD